MPIFLLFFFGYPERVIIIHTDIFMISVKKKNEKLFFFFTPIVDCFVLFDRSTCLRSVYVYNFDFRTTRLIFCTLKWRNNTYFTFFFLSACIHAKEYALMYHSTINIVLVLRKKKIREMKEWMSDVYTERTKVSYDVLGLIGIVYNSIFFFLMINHTSQLDRICNQTHVQRDN